MAHLLTLALDSCFTRSKVTLVISCPTLGNDFIFTGACSLRFGSVRRPRDPPPTFRIPSRRRENWRASAGFRPVLMGM